MEEVLEGMWGLFLGLSDLQEPWLGDVEMHYSDAQEKCWELAGGARKGKKNNVCVWDMNLQRPWILLLGLSFSFPHCAWENFVPGLQN